MLTHHVYKLLCFCLTLSAGKINFLSLKMGLPNWIISSPIYYHLILQISVLAWSLSQTNRQMREDMGYGALIIYFPTELLEMGLFYCTSLFTSLKL